MQARLFLDGAGGDFPYFFGGGAMRRIHHHQIGRQAMRKGAHFACGTAGGGLPGQRKRAVAGGGDLAGEQVGRASVRERGGQSVEISVGAVSVKKKKKKKQE